MNVTSSIAWFSIPIALVLLVTAVTSFNSVTLLLFNNPIDEAPLAFITPLNSSIVPFDSLNIPVELLLFALISASPVTINFPLL